MQRATVIFACFLNLMLSCESAHQQLNSINDLKKLDFEHSVPKHSLLLLYWFTSVLNIDESNTITMTFDPTTEFGSHPFRNYENMLDQLPLGYQYYTVGNLKPSYPKLPSYLHNPADREYYGRNRDRIIFSAERQTSGAYRIDRVYLTQHEPSSNSHDPQHTYQISTNLLREISQFSNGNPTVMWRFRNQFHSNIDNSQMSSLRPVWGDNLVCLGLLLFIVFQKNYSRPFNTYGNKQQSTSTIITFPSDEESSSSSKETDGPCADCCEVMRTILALILFVGLVILIYWIRTK